MRWRKKPVKRDPYTEIVAASLYALYTPEQTALILGKFAEFKARKASH